MSGLEQPKKPAGGGFGQFVGEKRKEFQAKCAGKPVSEVSKMAGTAWKALSEAEQAPYKKKFVEAQKKYDIDLAAFLAAGGEKTKGAAALRTEKRKLKEGKGAKKEKDPNAPKRPAGGAYGCFMAANRADFQKQCPGSITGVAKLAGEKWKAIAAGEKEKYEKEYKVKADAYQEAMKSYVPPAKEENDDDIEESPAKKAKVSKEDKKAAKEGAKDDKNAAKEEKKAAAAAKKSPKSVGKAALKKGAGAEEKVDIPETVLAKADKAGMTGALKKLLCRDDIKEAKISPSQAMTALEGAGGLLHKARGALLGA